MSWSIVSWRGVIQGVAVVMLCAASNAAAAERTKPFGFPWFHWTNASRAAEVRSQTGSSPAPTAPFSAGVQQKDGQTFVRDGDFAQLAAQASPALRVRPSPSGEARHHFIADAQVVPAVPELPPLDIGPTLEELLRGPMQSQLTVPCPDEFDRLKPITTITNRVAAPPGVFPPECVLEPVAFEQRAWDQTRFTWKATALCHKPLYFEQVALERYGHSCGPIITPILSGAHFFATVPLLPYKMGVETPNECVYSLGYYRPGSCAPYMIQPFPLSLRGALFEGAAATGLVFLLP